MRTNSKDVSRFADMLAAMGTEFRLRTMRLLLSAHPNGLVVGEIGDELRMAGSTCPLPRNRIAPQVDGKFMSAFVRAIKPCRPRLDLLRIGATSRSISAVNSNRGPRTATIAQIAELLSATKLVPSDKTAQFGPCEKCTCQVSDRNSDRTTS